MIFLAKIKRNTFTMELFQLVAVSYGLNNLNVESFIFAIFAYLDKSLVI